MRVAVNCADVREDRISSGEMDLVGQHVKDEGEGGVKMDYLKLSCRQPTEQEEIFANDMINKGLIPNAYKQLTQLNIKK